MTNLFLVHYFFFLCRSYSPWWPLAFLSFSPPLQNFYVVLPTKNVSFVLSLALALCRSFSRWASLACHLYSLFLCIFLSPAIFQICGHEAINLSLILNTTRIQKQCPLSVFVFIDSLVVFASQDRVAMRFPAKITSSCIWVAMPVDWVILLCYACGADGRSVGRTITRLPKFLGWIDYHIFLGMGLRSRAWSSAIRRPIGLLQ